MYISELWLPNQDRNDCSLVIDYDGSSWGLNVGGQGTLLYLPILSGLFDADYSPAVVRSVLARNQSLKGVQEYPITGIDSRFVSTLAKVALRSSDPAGFGKVLSQMAPIDMKGTFVFENGANYRR
jgi:hypothetical protein